MPSLAHTHIYIRDKRAKDTYKCADPDCTHRMHRDLLWGKRSTCAICREKQIVLNYEELKRAEPRCEDCSNQAKHREAREFKEKLKELGIE